MVELSRLYNIRLDLDIINHTVWFNNPPINIILFEKSQQTVVSASFKLSSTAILS